MIPAEREAPSDGASSAHRRRRGDPRDDRDPSADRRPPRDLRRHPGRGPGRRRRPPPLRRGRPGPPPAQDRRRRAPGPAAPPRGNRRPAGGLLQRKLSPRDLGPRPLPRRPAPDQGPPPEQPARHPQLPVPLIGARRRTFLSTIKPSLIPHAGTPMIVERT